MRSAVAGVVAIVALAVLVSSIEYRRSLVYAQLPAPGETGEGSDTRLIALSSDTSVGHQQVTVVDPRSRVMSVYHVDHATGMISLKSVRNIHADLLMDEYNTDSPLPREIRAILKQR